MRNHIRLSLGAVVTAAMLGPLEGPALAQSPAWWIARGVLTTNARNDFAPVNQGQVKWIASNAAAEFEQKLSVFGGAGTGITTMVGAFAPSNGYRTVNAGQLKNVAVVFYDRLGVLATASNRCLSNALPAGITGAYPWTVGTNDDANYSLANIGQAKRLFSFDFDRNSNGVPDWVETDADADGLTNGWETAHGTSPTNVDSDADGLVDGYSGVVSTNLYPGGVHLSGNAYVEGELSRGTSATNSDSDDDGVGDGAEVSAGTDPLDGNSPANLRGQIAYSGGQTGAIRVLAVTSASSWATNHSCTLTTPGSYRIANLPPTNYWIKAFRDSNANGSNDTSEAQVVLSSGPILITNRVTGIDLTLTDPDTDHDGLSDVVEFALGTVSTNWDTDADGLPDGWEVQYGFSPTVANAANADTDGDGLTDLQEAFLGTNPGSTNTDGDARGDAFDADPLDAGNAAAINDTTTTRMTLTVGDTSDSQSERYKIVVGPYALAMPLPSDGEHLVSMTVLVPRNKVYDGYLEVMPSGDTFHQGDYLADVTGEGISILDEDMQLPDGRPLPDRAVLRGYHEDSGFTSGRLHFRVRTGSGHLDEDSVKDTKPDSKGATVGDPINVINGDVSARETDGVVVCPGPDLEFSRYYNSHLDYEGPLGPHWTHTYDWKLSWTNCEYRGVTSSWARLRTGTGDQLWFGQTGTGSTWRAVGRNATLAPTGTMYRVVVDDSSFYLFDGTDGTLQTISDRTGRQIALAYEDGLLSTATHDNGWQLIFGYDENGRLGEVESAEMHDFCVVFFYNAGGELSDALQLPADAPDPGYYWLTYSYGDHHELTGRVNAAGDTFTYTYEIITNAEQVVVAKGRSSTVGTDLLRTAVGFDTASDVSTVTYDRGDVTQTLVYAYSDENLMVRAITNVSAGTVTARTTTGARDATSERETDLATGAFVESAVGYDEQHRTWSTSFGLNAGPQNPWFTRWNEDGLLQALIDPEDNYPSKPDRTTFEYLNGLPIAVHSWYTSSNSFSTGFRYENGLLCDVTNANGHVLTMEYEAAGDRPSLVTPPAGPATAYRYSWYDESPMKVFVGVGGRTNTLYRDGWYRVYRIDYPDGLSEAVGYDGAGNPTNLTDRAGHQTRWTYAPTGKLQLMVSDAEGIAATNRFDYDRQFNTLAIVDANGRGVESYQLDLQDRPVSVTNVQGQVMSVTYLIGDYVSRLLRFDGSQVSNAYDGDGNLAAAFFADTTNRYGWRADGLLKTAGDGRSAATNGYDNVNRLAGQTNFYSPYLSTVAFQTDPVGNVTGEFWKVLSGGAAIRSETNLYRYDVGERLTNQVANGASYAYSYDSSNGLPDLVQYPNGLKVSYSYDLVDRLTGVVWSNGAGQVASFRYVFDHGDMVSNRTAIIAGTTNVYRYIYDGLDRLTWVSAGGSNSLFTYDKAGNRINTDVDWGWTNWAGVTYSYGAANQLESWGATGRMQYDAAGCVTNLQTNGGAALGLGWDSQRRLVAVTNTASALGFQYAYDALGRRVSSATVQGGAASRTNHIYSGPHVVADVDQSGHVTRSYAYGPGIDRILSMTVFGASTNTYYYLTDHLGSVMALTDANGAIVERYEYDAWGKVAGVWDGSGNALSVSQFGNRYLWQGREYVWATGLYYFRARWYEPDSGRWLSNDPIGISGGLNQYVFCGNNPVNFGDPFGLCMKGGSLARTGISIGVGCLPLVGAAQSIVELITGYDFVAGEETSRGWAAAGIVAGLLPGGKGALKGFVKGGEKLLGHGDAISKLTKWGWKGSKEWRDAARVLERGGTVESIGGKIASESEAVELLHKAGATVERIEGGHLPPNPHSYPHVNYTTAAGIKGVIRIQ